jgi:superfamily I DNA/RNA helicase
MRSRAIAQATGRTPAAASRAGRLLAWLRERGLELPDLRKLGAALLVQRSAQRLARAPNAYVAGVPLRYRRFRRTMREESRWYASGRFAALDAHPSEVDIILLAMLRTARDMERNGTLMRRLADRAPPLLDAIARLRRNQVLVDESTDFSPVQLACMRALASPATDSFFASGDFNQRLTRWGSRSEEDLLWVSPGMIIERIDVSYRQSRRLANFARALRQTQGYEINDRSPDHTENFGYQPVLGLSLASIAEQADWLASRIREINAITSSALPTIAVLVSNAEALEPLATALTEELEGMNIQAVACPKGMVKGQAGDVRIFEIEHIKGLEFEAVFFMDIDTLKEREPDLFDRYIYVGATRAATFLGLTCSGDGLPSAMEPVMNLFEDRWL